MSESSKEHQLIVALMRASENGNGNMVKLLLNKGVPVDTRDEYGWTALMHASVHGHTNVVKMLLDKGAQVDIICTSSTLMTVIENKFGNTDIVRMLPGVEGNVVIPNTGFTALMLASISGHTEVVKLLLDRNAPIDIVNIVGWTALISASSNGHTEVVNLLLDGGAQVDFQSFDQSCTALIEASKQGHLNVVRLLLDKGAQVNLTGDNEISALLVACQYGHTDVVQLLLDKGADVTIGYQSKEGCITPLMIACEVGYTKVVKLLLAKGAEVNFHSECHCAGTALMAACRNGHSEVVKLLLDNGADSEINSYSDDGLTALMLACQNGHTEVVKLLLNKGAEVNFCSNNGWTALIRASKSGQIDTVKLLLSKGAQINFQGYRGATALMIAITLGHESIVEVLVDHGADIYIKGEEGMSALQLAIESSRDDILKLLLGSESEIESNEPETNDEESESEGNSESEFEESESKHDSQIKPEEKVVPEEKLLAAIEIAIKNGGIITNVLLHGVFVGPPHSGKDSLMKRLMGEMLSDTSPSTGVAEKVIYAKMEKSTTIPATIEGSKWTRLMYDEEALQIMKTASSKNINITQEENRMDLTECYHKFDPSMLDKVSLKSEQHVKTSHAFEFFDIHSNLSPSASLSLSRSSEPTIVQKIISQSKHKTPMEIFKEAVRNKDIESLRQCLTNTQLLYLTNTGGQIEFQELLPLLVSGPSVFFITFQLHRNITNTFSVVYELPSGELSKSYQSSLSVMESILQTLSSISAMSTYVYKGIQREAVPLRPKVFIVGTHKDLLEKKSAEAYIDSTDRYLQSVIKSTSHYREGIIQFASESQMIFTVNNHDPNDSDFQRIRTAVEEVVETGDYRIRSPARWMVYSFVVRQLQDPIQSYNECYAIAKECGIREKDEFDEALHFIHMKLGLIRYFPYKDLADVVIIDPQILFEKITELIVETFTFENVGKHAMETFKNKGIFSLSDFERINIRTSCQSFTPKSFVQLLEHLRIAAPLRQDGVIKYFIPCALAHADKKEVAFSTSVLPPLLVTFQCGYCPKGIFGTLIAYLIANEMQSSFEWEVITERIYRDEVTFQVGPYDIITVRFLLTHLEITLMASNPDLPREHCSEEEVCQEIHQTVEKGIKEVTSSVNYINTQHSFTFYCTSETCKSDLHPAKLNRVKEKICSLNCDKQKTCFPLPLGYEKWQLDSTEIHSGLKKDHYSSLISQLSSCAAQWREIGTHLGFQQHELNIIEARPLLLTAAPKSWLSALISEWMKWAPGDSRGSTKNANLKDLKSAVSKAGFGIVADGLAIT